MSQLNEKVATLLRDAVPALVSIVSEGRVRSARIRFTDPNGPTYSNFWWISVDTLKSDGEGTKIFARTNDLDLMVGYPPSFHMAVALENAGEMIDPIVAFLSEKFANAQRIDIWLQADANQGESGIANQVGNSDDGLANITVQEVPDIC